MGDPLPLWGRPLEEYTDSYLFENIRQRGIFNDDPGPTLAQEAASALSALAQIGDGVNLKESSAVYAPITIQNLWAILKLIQYPKAYRSLAQPSAIGGCIKLMAGIQLDGKISPFSYEYGYLCFRVLNIVLGICILQRSDRLKSSIQAMEMDVRTNPRLEIMQIFGLYVSTFLVLEISGGSLPPGDEDHFDWVFGWNKVKGRPNLSLLVRTSDVELLSTLLWEDRKTFFKALKSTYYPGISAVIFVLWRVSRRERNPTRSNIQITALNEISFRYNLIATSDQQRATEHMNMFIGAGNSLATWERGTKQINLEDSREVIGAYIDRFNPQNSLLYEPISVLDGPILLRALTKFVAPGTEDLLPSILELNVKRIWNEMKTPTEPHKPDVYVDAIRDTFTNYSTILQNRVFFVRPNNSLFEKLVDIVVKQDLIDLAARAILMLELPSDPPPPDLAGSQDYLSRVKLFYAQLCASMPKQHIYVISEHSFPEWLKFRSYLLWYPEIRRLVPEDRNHIMECLGVWNNIGKALGYQVHEKLHFKCGYARCHDPIGIGGVQFTCPVCYNRSYCSARCQSLDWNSGGSQGPHMDSCVTAKVLARFRPSV